LVVVATTTTDFCTDCHNHDKRPATFSGILAFIEHNFGLRPLGKNDAHAYDFHNAFDYSQAPLAGAHGQEPAPTVGETHPHHPRPGRRPELTAADGAVTGQEGHLCQGTFAT
jgi:hypothetical protein